MVLMINGNVFSLVQNPRKFLNGARKNHCVRFINRLKVNCLGKTRCRLFVTDEMFGPTHCKGPVSLAFLATCTRKT
ncbi:unnamed protein product [Thlaspi arvense]|uniref:SUEL-type lectin domain-containing protein n=1 Tax=Thlaspi arvense TaxID=13288 RepID=A0AAU9SDW3_THLAR|nr:unnamed protein product [Thlaspi arvense]